MEASRRRLSALVLCLSISLPSAPAAAQGAGGDTLAAVVEVRDGEGRTPTDLQPDELFVVERGVSKEVLGIGRPASWRVAIYVDLSLSRPQTLAAAAGALSSSLAQMLRLGTLEVVLSDYGLLEVTGPTRDHEELAELFAELGEHAVDAGELFELRTELRRELESIDDRRERDLVAGESLEEEIQLVGEQRDALLGWVAEASDDGAPHLLLLVADAPYVVEENRAGALLAPQPTTQAPDATLAAAGWTVLPLALTSDVSPLESLAEATGGAAVHSPGELASELERAARRLEIRYPASAEPLGAPYPFEVRSRRQGLEVRGPRWATSVTPEGLAEARAKRVLTTGAPLGRLRVEPTLRSEMGELPGSRRPVEIAHLDTVVVLDYPHAGLDSSSLRTTLLLEVLDGPPLPHHRFGGGKDLARAGRWLGRSSFPLPDEIDRIAVVVEDMASGRWGGAVAEVVDVPVRPAAALMVAEQLDFLPYRPAGPVAADDGAKERRGTLIRLLPPRQRPAVGSARVQALVTNVAVRSVTFSLDGVEVETDDRPPFSASLDLGAEVEPHLVEAVAFDRSGTRLGSDEIRLNQPTGGFEVTVAALEVTAQTVEVEAEVNVPAGGRLDRVEVFYNESLATRLDEPPYRARLSRLGNAATDYVTVVAHLDDGSRAEDTRLLAAPGEFERIEVNLVELYVVVTDRDGEPVGDLQANDFRVLQGNREQPIDRFTAAEEVPLVLGLVVDTSTSMASIMPETKMAAVRFLGDILSPADRAFVVDFANEPRLAQDTTGDLFTLVSSLGRLDADGNTALYDAIVFSILQFQDDPGRKALVLLSDGDDYRSRFGYRRVYQAAGAAGLPIYMLGIAALDPDRPSFRKSDLEGIAAVSGGRVFYIEDRDQLTSAYDTIAAELRSQYLLTFTSDRELTDKEVASLAVQVPGRKVDVRLVVGNR